MRNFCHLSSAYLFLCLFLGAAHSCLADQSQSGERITLTSTITTTIIEEDLEFILELENSGNAVAVGVQPEVVFSDYRQLLDKRDIQPGEVVTFTLQERDFVGRWLPRKGSYGLRVFIHYLDGEKQEHVTAAYGQLLYGIGANEQKLEVVTDPVVLQDQAKLSLAIRNTGTEAIDVTLSFFSGEGLQFFPPRQTLSLLAEETRFASVRVENPRKVVRTTLPAFAVLNYDSADLVISQVKEATITLSEQSFGESTWTASGANRLGVILGALFLTLVLIIASGFWSKKQPV